MKKLYKSKRKKIRNYFVKSINKVILFKKEINATARQYFGEKNTH